MYLHFFFFLLNEHEYVLYVAVVQMSGVKYYKAGQRLVLKLRHQKCGNVPKFSTKTAPYSQSWY
jgi:hypothetical protein